MEDIDELKAQLEAIRQDRNSTAQRVTFADGRSIEQKSDRVLARSEQRIKDKIAALENKRRTRVMRVNDNSGRT